MSSITEFFNVIYEACVTDLEQLYCTNSVLVNSSQQAQHRIDINYLVAMMSHSHRSDSYYDLMV